MKIKPKNLEFIKALLLRKGVLVTDKESRSTSAYCFAVGIDNIENTSVNTFIIW